MYVIAAVQSNRPDKVNEFFEKMTPQLQGQSGWSEWFGETNCFFTSSCYLVGVAQVTLLFRLPSFLVLCLCCDGCPSPYSRSPHVSFQAVFPCSISVPLLLALLFSASFSHLFFVVSLLSLLSLSFIALSTFSFLSPAYSHVLQSLTNYLAV